MSPLELYRRMLAAFGPQGWWPAETPLEMMVGAVLVQAVTWTNATQAISRLKERGALALPALLALPSEELLECLRPTRFYRQKAGRLRRLLYAVWQAGGVEAYLQGPTRERRAALLAIDGLGPETADSILLYAGGHPVFVVDAYTRRAGARLGLFPKQAAYGEVQAFFQEMLSGHEAVFGDFHAQWVELSKTYCTKRKPNCPSCPLRDLCPKRYVAERQGGDG